MSKLIGFVYKLEHRTRTDTPVYIGSTKCLGSRWANHQYSCNNDKQTKYNYYVYEFIRDYGGIDNWKITQLVQCIYKTTKELVEIERTYIDKYLGEGIKLLNKVIPLRTLEEYNKYYKDKQKEVNIQSRLRNRDKHNQKRKEYYHKNKEKIILKNIEYYNKNKDKVNNNRSSKITCLCGDVIALRQKNSHLTTAKHHTKLLSELLKTINQKTLNL
tara:strand:- start:649 stop:1293 length:645 start_codon:yes stop_codon:yes gene_type:complete